MIHLKRGYLILFKNLVLVSVFVIFFVLYLMAGVEVNLGGQKLSYRGFFNQSRSNQTMTDNSDYELMTAKEFFDTCDLPKIDAWSKEIVDHFDPQFNLKSECKKFFYETKLVDGKLFRTYIRKNAEKLKCYGRCIGYEQERSLTHDKWTSINKHPDHVYDCEIVEAICSQNETTDTKKAEYGAIHLQFQEKKEERPKMNGSLPMNVFVILVDSVGHSQSHRNFPKTLHFLEKSMSAITFPYVNKVARNSAPNAIALWLGKVPEMIDRTQFEMPYVKDELNVPTMCQKNITEEKELIFNMFRNAGYRTLFGDDTKNSPLGYNGCVGFDKQPTDHYLLPFSIAAHSKNHKALYKAYRKDNKCLEIHKEYLKYLGDFVEAYGDTPKFSWLWLTQFSHNHASGAVTLDTDVYEFLVKHKQTLENSFFILMADHGLRFGKVAKTKIGSLDNNNPMLVMSIPKVLRANAELMKVLHENSQQLQTHFDTRATLLDILRHQPEDKYRNYSTLDIYGERGNSYLRKQPTPRNCKTLPIPFEYCICEFELEERNSNTLTAIKAGVAVIDKVNAILVNANLTQCEPWTFNYVDKFLAYAPIEVTNTYKIYVTVSYPYMKAEFWSIVRIIGNTIDIGEIDRIDSYGSRGDCVGTGFRRLCHCK